MAQNKLTKAQKLAKNLEMLNTVHAAAETEPVHKFAVGQQVTITTIDTRANGKQGVIVGIDDACTDLPYHVDIPGLETKLHKSMGYEWYFMESELKAVDAPARNPQPQFNGIDRAEDCWSDGDDENTAAHLIYDMQPIPTLSFTECRDLVGQVYARLNAEREAKMHPLPPPAASDPLPSSVIPANVNRVGYNGFTRYLILWIDDKYHGKIDRSSSDWFIAYTEITESGAWELEPGTNGATYVRKPVDSPKTDWNARALKAEARVDEFEAALNTGMYISLEHVATLLDHISVSGWEARYAGAMGFTIGLLQRVDAVLKDGEDIVLQPPVETGLSKYDEIIAKLMVSQKATPKGVNDLTDAHRREIDSLRRQLADMTAERDKFQEQNRLYRDSKDMIELRRDKEVERGRILYKLLAEHAPEVLTSSVVKTLLEYDTLELDKVIGRYMSELQAVRDERDELRMQFDSADEANETRKATIRRMEDAILARESEDETPGDDDSQTLCRVCLARATSEVDGVCWECREKPETPDMET